MSDISVGHTNDGKVFLKQGYLSDLGEPLETTIVWNALQAAEIGKCLIGAAEAASAQKTKEGSNNDSATTNRGST
jgi:hypothetical protein